ncbi:hypothetical protein A3E97_02835 [Candidatus Uhrbacteria bacterium RIFCSPHIGHO2_12_FULL_47_12]|uniref:Uncharacterized protein n=1 Tax=Candidatus Uhrbacteria bacterium RIFCSPLOWO2_02_FULL_48_18 TaxID=1802408 RepID=A0A1F7V994_9BACT|nr:MAG: hypothetical protein A2839_01250 [Candidatus Uhrbacteria bacterium RIFCSPHIGHO2_01_FULL_47_10]OGL76146.1 MAG: hypothetical protein A3E97_02835 [Candidatus Uhrbacteria bacterium RIFCSPHIGHO2_12_FULL_47_12]OGL81933.1 MAG: hypothetical protein A3B20_02515 [Candidatus Uhrbacteria bacterium RIFCSPLOWO2_01_FULL_47_17]OGL87096.1 MAG: hypothetical protein A3I41_04105 [Candidatus Uhrbacteria bacterium RIFCSPLOWO2_02_FULL_48_18]
MNLFLKDNLEGLIEHVHSINVPECEEHRYALRRMLLNSTYFDEHRNAVRRRAMLFVPAAASMFVVAVLFVASQTHPGTLTEDIVEQPIVVINKVEPSFLTKGLSATFIDDRPMIPVTFQPNTILFSTATMAMKLE